jgi:hypothetical protein
MEALRVEMKKRQEITALAWRIAIAEHELSELKAEKDDVHRVASDIVDINEFIRTNVTKCVRARIDDVEYSGPGWCSDTHFRFKLAYPWNTNADFRVTPHVYKPEHLPNVAAEAVKTAQALGVAEAQCDRRYRSYRCKVQFFAE